MPPCCTWLYRLCSLSRRLDVHLNEQDPLSACSRHQRCGLNQGAAIEGQDQELLHNCLEKADVFGASQKQMLLKLRFYSRPRSLRSTRRNCSREITGGGEACLQHCVNFTGCLMGTSEQPPIDKNFHPTQLQSFPKGILIVQKPRGGDVSSKRGWLLPPQGSSIATVSSEQQPLQLSL